MEAPRELPVEIDLDPRMPGTMKKAGETKDTIHILIYVHDPGKVFKIGKNLGERLRNKLATFLKKNQDVFVLCNSYMVGIDPPIMCHHLNIDQERTCQWRKGCHITRRSGSLVRCRLDQRMFLSNLASPSCIGKKAQREVENLC